MSPTRTELVKWLATKEIKGRTLDIGGSIWSMMNIVKSFEGKYETLNEDNCDLNDTYIEGEDYDHIFCTEVMQFVYAPTTVLFNLENALAEKGQLYLSFHLTHPPMKSHDYLRYTEKGIRRLMEDAELEIVEFLEPLPGYYLVQCQRSQ